MKVLYDYQGFIQRIGGVSRYSVELIRNLSNGFEPVLPKILSDNVYLKESGIPHYSFFSSNRKPLKYNIYKALNMIQSMAYLRLSDFDIFHPLFIRPYYIGHVKKPVVVTVYDMNHDRFPTMLPKAEIVQKKEKKSCERADAIITISEETKRDLIKYHNISEEKIHVVYLGCDQELINVEKKRIHEKEYILYIGGRSGYKNFATFLKGFSLLKGNIDLVCTGVPFNQSELSLIRHLGLQNRIYQQFVSDEELNNLLCHAIAFVYPSLGEGFGIPLLESFRCSCPCFASDILCFHEVAGDAAMYFNPNDADDIAHVIEKGLSDKTQLEWMKQQGIIQLRKFTWEKTARGTENVYRKLV